MADQLERNTRAPNPEIENDDPLAELARIIGYERPAGDQAENVRPSAPEQGGFDLESELMRELDVLPLDGFDELDQADDTEVSQPQAVSPDITRDQPADTLERNDTVEGDPFEFSASWLDNKPETPGDNGADAMQPFTDNEVEADLENPDALTQSASTDGDAASDDGLSLPGVSVAPPPSDISDDAVLADMYRYELPNRSAGPAAGSPNPSATAESAPDVEAVTETVVLPDFENETDANQNPEWVETAPVSDADHSGHDGLGDQAGSGAGAAGSGLADIDFEDYLSAELDVFEQHASMGAGATDPEQARESGSWEQNAALLPDDSEFAKDDGIADASPAGSTEGAASAERNNTPAEDGFSLEDDFLFDEAAEELLADMEQDEAIKQAGLDNDYTDENLEAGLDEGLSGELEDLFSFDDDDAPASSDNRNSAGDLELDMDQVLAEAVIDPAVASQTSAPNRSSGDLERALAGAVVPSAMRGASAFSSSRDEMTEAFKDLVSDQGGEAPAPAEPEAATPDAPTTGSGRPAASAEEDWLSGSDATPDDAGPPEASGDSGFFFDSDLIAEPDEPVETLSEIDVPEITEDELWVSNPNFESEVDQEFSDIIDSDLIAADAGGERESRSEDASASAWGLDSQQSEAEAVDPFDDYSSLERELGGRGISESDADVAPPYGAAGSGSDQDALGGEFASGLQRADDGEARDSRAPMVALIVLGIAVFAGAGAFGWSMISGGDGDAADGPRIIRADKEPVKVLPENPGGVTVPNQDKAVYDRVAGGDAAQTGQPALVNTAEEPVDVVQRTLDPDVLPLEGRNEVAAVKSEDRLTSDGATEVSGTSGASAPVVSPRRVRTMIVRPDGSIVPREEPEPEVAQAEPVAGTETVAASQPEDAGTVAPVAASQEPTQDAAAPTAAGTGTAEADVAEAGTGVEPAVPEAPTEGTVAPVRVVTTQPIRAPVPQGRPADQPVNVVGTVTQGGNVANPVQAPAAQTAQPAPAAQEVASAAAAPVSNPGGYYVQIASQPTAEGAQASWQTLSSRYSGVIGGRSVDIQRADIPGKGIFHRVRIPAGGRDEANALCSRYKAAGGSCFVSR
ncbi:MAG: SPOR domain-containing protein [Hoeflea sp.]|uniref:SPOR domain-containing protein n=1 Tax=Hoeflea sp. TaxID=1940281 RepID=UPI0032F04470